MDVVVTGGAGFIGSHIVERFLAQGKSVAILDDLSSGKRENVPHGAELHVVDIREAAAAEKLRQLQPRILVHAAAQISVTASMREPARDASINLCGLLNILQSFAGAELPYVVFLSTGGAIYGEQDVFPAAEDHPCRPTSVYGTSKRASELYLDLWRRQYGLRYAALRLANVYGPRQDPHGEAGVVAIFAQALLENRVPTIFGTGEQTRDFVFVQDVARAVEAASRSETNGVYNIGTGKETSVNELYALMAAAIGSETKPAYAPARAGEQLRSVIAAQAAGQAFGWRPQHDLRGGLDITCEWFRTARK